ncbi:isochorismatase family protein [Microbispora bryophytorum]|uniref:isochorismatase family protein n=1 Tax=Microbispora bryophytorum TaxID=1460882 RepID=UPI0033F0315A
MDEHTSPEFSRSALLTIDLQRDFLADGLTKGELDPDLLLAGHAQEIGPDEHILYKPPWSAFFRTRLLERLAERAVSTVVVAGCNYPNCPRATLVDATERDLRAVAVRDALSGWTADADREMAGMGIARLNTSEVVAAIRTHVASSG